MTRVLVCGGRDYADVTGALGRTLDHLRDTRGVRVLIEGDARGADREGRAWARRRGIPVETYFADWTTHGRAAGPLRNAEMLAEGRPDICVAAPGGRGTADMVAKARAADIEVIEVAP